MSALPRMDIPPSALPDDKRITIVAFSGDMDKLLACLSLANSAAAMGREVTIFFTFWGMSAIRKRKAYSKKPWLDRILTFMLPAHASSVGMSRMNMLGAGPLFFRHLMRRKNVSGVAQLVETAQALGVEMIACSMSMDVMGIQSDELIEGVHHGGAAACVQDICGSGTALFI
ncbi:MAG: DsrE/DsrF/DrsH-like family protein [Planctomycetota bacterium]